MHWSRAGMVRLSGARGRVGCSLIPASGASALSHRLSLAVFPLCDFHYGCGKQCRQGHSPSRLAITALAGT